MKLNVDQLILRNPVVFKVSILMFLMEIDSLILYAAIKIGGVNCPGFPNLSYGWSKYS